MSHTKGKWLIEERENEFMVNVLANGKRICEIKSFIGKPFNDPTKKEAEANAKLIAAAPDMLKALISAEMFHQGFHSPIGTIIRKAIEKATK